VTNGEVPTRRFDFATRVLLLLGLIMQAAGMLALGMGAKLFALVSFLLGLLLVGASIVAFVLSKLMRIHNVKLP
jgi:hypothetical protein